MLMRPERAKVFDVYNILELLPLQGVVQCTYFTQGVALGYGYSLGLQSALTNLKLIIN